jgi:plasmid maintenance system killer protein
MNLRKLSGKPLIIFISCFLYAGYSNAQIENEIKSFVDSSEVIVNNGRRLLVNEIKKNNNEKAEEIYDYLTAYMVDKPYDAFSYSEKIYISLILRKWYTFQDLSRNYTKHIESVPYPNTYPIINPLYNKITNNVGHISEEMSSADLTAKDKQILSLLLTFLEEGMVNEKYNELWKNYAEGLKSSEYKDFFLSYLPRKSIRGAMAISMGGGPVIPTDRLSDMFSSNACFNMALDININRIYSSLYLNGTNLKLLKPFTAVSNRDSLFFYRNEEFSYLEAGLKGGYFSIRNQRFHLAPYLSISGSSLKSTRFEPEEDDLEVEIFNSFSCGGGIHAEIKISDFNYTNSYGYNTNSYFSFKINGGYNLITSFEDNQHRGSIIYFNFSLVYGFGTF